MELQRSWVVSTVLLAIWPAGVACVADINTDVMLDPPPEARAVALAVVKDNELEVQAFDLDDPPASLPADPDYAEGTRFSISVRYYPERLEELGIPSGVLPARELEEEFGPLPASTIPDAVRVVDDDGDTGWQEGALDERVQEFMSPVLPFDPSACFELSLLAQVPLATFEEVIDLAASEGQILALTQKERGTMTPPPQLSFVSERSSDWVARLIDGGPQQVSSLPPLLEGASLREVEADPGGGFLISACAGPIGRLIVGHPETGFELVETPTTSPCATSLVAYEDQEGEQLWAYGAPTIAHYRKMSGRWRYQTSVPAPALSKIEGFAGFGLYGIEERPDEDPPPPVRRIYRLGSDQRFSEELIPFEQPSEEVVGIVATPTGLTLATRGSLLGIANRFYRRDTDGWSLFDRNADQGIHSIAPFYTGLVYATIANSIGQLSTSRTCMLDAFTTTRVWIPRHLQRLSDRRFAVAGLKTSQAADRGRALPADGPNHIAIMEARLRAP